MYDVHDWAEVRRLYHREHLSKAAIARRLGMSRPTVIRLLELGEPPRYERRSTGSKLDPHKDAITAMLDEDATVAATVILEHLRRDGYAGGITIVKDHVARVRPAFLAARSYRRTTLSPGRARPRRLMGAGEELAGGDYETVGGFRPRSPCRSLAGTPRKTGSSTWRAASRGCRRRVGPQRE